MDHLNKSATYENPVYDHSFPDPFVLKHLGEYWAYCTGFWNDGRCFGVLHSRDLVNWRALTGAMEPLDTEATCYWAPEVVYENGRFLMYYSVGNEERMQIRVAVADRPGGPYIDAGRGLTSEDFAIDPHVFVDDDGARYLFYATDFLTHTHIGTGTVIDRMLDPWTLEGHPRPVTRARYDWQVYDPKRAEKGGVRWHTVEGPFVLKHKGRYYEMFSGGNWKNLTYGVSYATSDRIDTPTEWTQVCDGERVFPIMRTVPDRVTGPGHNSVVRGPENRELFCVYHRWTPGQDARVMAIDRLDWAGERMIVFGPSTTPQPAPIAPTVTGWFDGDSAGGLGQNWTCEAGGRWVARQGAAVQELTQGEARARCVVGTPGFLAELSARALRDMPGEYGVELWGGNGPDLRFVIAPAEGQAIASQSAPAAGWTQHKFDLPLGFDPTAYHRFRIEVDQGFVHLALDNVVVRWHARLERLRSCSVALVTREMAAAFSGFALTVGWEDDFTRVGAGLNELGWQSSDAADRWYLKDDQLCCAANTSKALITRGPAMESYEMVVNAKLFTETATGGCYGFYPALRVGVSGMEPGPLVTVERSGKGWAVFLRASGDTRRFSLPENFDPGIHQQFRFRKRHRHLALHWEAEALGAADAPEGPTQPGLSADRAAAAFDMVRITAL